MSTSIVVTVRRLQASIAETVLLRNIELDLVRGRILAIVGASGSGKTTLARTLLGETDSTLMVDGTVDVSAPVAYLPQHPAAVLNPVRRIGAMLRETAMLREAIKSDADARITEVLRRTRLTVPGLSRRFPHQLSGGQQQRLVLAQALLCRAGALIADEPTTGQDAMHAAEVASELRVAADSGLAVMLLTHDLDLVESVADEVAVLNDGAIVEKGQTTHIFGSPEHEYTRRLLQARAASLPPVTSGRHAELLSATGLSVRSILHGVNLSLQATECRAIIGPSGSGKTTLARCLAGLQRVNSGSITLDGQPFPRAAGRRDRKQRARVQYVFQDAKGSFDQYRSIREQVARTAIRLRGTSSTMAWTEAEHVLSHVGIPPELAARRPGRLSGGELQRVALARALTAKPEVLICDEITSGLDTITRKSIVELLGRLRSQVTLLLITHQLTVVTELADTVTVLAAGQVIEDGPAEKVLASPEQHTTRMLMPAPQRKAVTLGSSTSATAYGDHSGPTASSRHG